MKKLTIILALITIVMFASSFNSSNKNINVPTENVVTDFNEGFEDGWCEGYKDDEGCGSLAICPISPIPPIPSIGQSYDSYRDGYNEGFKRGLRRGMSDCD